MKKQETLNPKSMQVQLHSLIRRSCYFAAVDSIKLGLQHPVLARCRNYAVRHVHMQLCIDTDKGHA